jgi:hypothetical protein
MRVFVIGSLVGALLLCSCAKKENTQAQIQGASSGGPHASVILTDGTKVPGSVVASTPSDITVLGDNGIEQKIPVALVKSIEYGSAPANKPAPSAPPPASRPAQQAATPSSPPAQQPAAPSSQLAGAPGTPPPLPPPAMATFELPAGSQLSVRVNETIDSAVAREGQMFDAQTTRDAQDAGGAVVIPRGSRARVVI